MDSSGLRLTVLATTVYTVPDLEKGKSTHSYPNSPKEGGGGDCQ